MSRENVEVVRRSFEARNRGDIEASIADADPDIVFDFSAAVGPYRGVYRGLDGLRELWNSSREAFSEMSWEAEEFIDVGDAVVVPTRFRSRGRGSGVETVARGAGVYWLREGKIVRFMQCQGREAGLKAARSSTYAMARRHVDIVRAAFAALEVSASGDLTDEVLGDAFDPEVEWVPVPQGVLGGGSYRGYDGIRRFWADFFAAWDEFRVEPQEFRAVGDRVVVLIRMRGRAHGVAIDEVWSGLWTLRNQRIVRVQAFANRDGAFEAARRQE